MLSSLCGIRVVVSEAAMQKTQFRFPRSKRKRIRKKWAKRDCNYKYTPGAYMIEGNMLVCHPVVHAQLVKRFSRTHSE
jgi:hypothetical protein